MKLLNKKLRNASVASVCESLLRYRNENALLQSDPQLAEPFAALEEKSRALLTAIRSDKVLSSLGEADDLRDRHLTAIGYLLRAHALSHDPDIEAAAEAVAAVFDKYGPSIARKPLAEESVLVNSLLEDLSAEPVDAAIQKIPGLGGVLSALAEAERAFEDAFDQHRAACAAQKTAVAATNLKKDAVLLLNTQILPYINTMTSLNPARFQTVHDNIEQIVERALKG